MKAFMTCLILTKKKKVIEYDVCLINGQKYNVKVIAERVEEEIMEKMIL